ncbi:MAG: hypothetical protein WBC90_00080 [Albidovulum sp.]
MLFAHPNAALRSASKVVGDCHEAKEDGGIDCRLDKRSPKIQEIAKASEDGCGDESGEKRTKSCLLHTDTTSPKRPFYGLI